MTLPEFGEKGFKIRGGRNILLEDPEPIDYRAEEATLLTGVNSGGKTTTLDLVAQVYVLAHMGFPVPAEEAVVEPVDRIYYYCPSKNTMNSGAFEGALRKFENVLELDGSKLVLADELENITEPGASARIISGIIEILKEQGGTAVFVSHLAEKIRREANCQIQVDGIEAEGLDGDMNLIVDRTPKKDLLATSTPELVVKKLASRRNSELYDKLVEKFG
ncbi:hypothetical protein AKJ66_01970 [candidate division MSBL1 archaeon SCGC-AAA259E22]|uniref:DNA mismatch repair proteins mutS family domain-containing protein n=1 Tax=candidate division MSBL1 archaeon SCGC-AAA259E22 TaxID=1698265 RepID=A0A133UH28_9EURY|nr:hypothetical protein AKJ66_01970 [candidate division MSBL1 archaeon SCGC-AAA259E22]